MAQTWVKQCQCKSAIAEFPTVHCQQKQDGNVVTLTLSLEPGPVCRKCGAEWKKEAGDGTD